MQKRVKVRPIIGEMFGCQWFKNGDHYDDKVSTNEIKEGEVVRYFRHPCVPGHKLCKECGHTMHEHGWIDNDSGGYTVCPGDVIIESKCGYIPVSIEKFNAQYEMESMSLMNQIVHSSCDVISPGDDVKLDSLDDLEFIFVSELPVKRVDSNSLNDCVLYSPQHDTVTMAQKKLLKKGFLNGQVK